MVKNRLFCLDTLVAKKFMDTLQCNSHILYSKVNSIKFLKVTYHIEVFVKRYNISFAMTTDWDSSSDHYKNFDLLFNTST